MELITIVICITIVTIVHMVLSNKEKDTNINIFLGELMEEEEEGFDEGDSWKRFTSRN